MGMMGWRQKARIFPRRCIIFTGLIALLIVLFTLSLCLGDFPVTLMQVLAALIGRGDETVAMVILEWRLPRSGVAILMGAALGMSGAIFQSLFRNPLGSPDIIGFDAGAFTGATLALLAGYGFIGRMAGALGAGALTSVAVYALAWKNGVQGMRLILTGIGLGQLLAAVGQWLLLSAEPETAVSVSVWAIGTLNGVETHQFFVTLGFAVVLVPVGIAQTGALRQLELGDDVAQASGLAVERARRRLVVTGGALAALSTAVVGPIAFVALIAPQQARLFMHGSGVSPAAAGLVGAALLSSADIAAQHLFGETQVPVGTVMLCLGGVWLLWMLSAWKTG